MNHAELIEVTDVAKLIRRALKEMFPTHKFSVKVKRSIGGSSIDIENKDDPKVELLMATKRDMKLKFTSSRFDGMTDSTTHVNHTMDGKLVFMGATYLFSKTSTNQLV